VGAARAALKYKFCCGEESVSSFNHYNMSSEDQKFMQIAIEQAKKSECL
jgi:hypothetical protein